MFKKIKKQNGERFAKVLRGFHNGIFEIPDILQIVRHAGNTPEDAEQICSYLMSLLLTDDDEPDEVEDPFALLDQAGYEAYYADTKEKQDAIKKYFQSGEKLCTFGTNRFKNYYIINAIRKDVDNIRREDFRGKEKRDDEYGTSVMSIQVAKRGGFISIKNRYNHSVPNCDNTLKSNPDNIIFGLSQAIQEHFSVSFSTKQSVLPDDYMLVGRNIFKVSVEISGIFYGDRAYVKNGEIVEPAREKGLYLFDYFIFDAQTKTFSLVPDSGIIDSFPETFNKVYGGKKSIYVKKHCIYDGDIMLVGV
jgi:hypothetical protein